MGGEKRIGSTDAAVLRAHGAGDMFDGFGKLVVAGNLIGGAEGFDRFVGFIGQQQQLAPAQRAVEIASRLLRDGVKVGCRFDFDIRASNKPKTPRDVRKPL